MDASPTFGQLLRRARRAAGLTQEALAERAGISARAVIDLERGVNRAPRRDTLELLATALELSSDELASWERLRHRLSLRSAVTPASVRPDVQRSVLKSNLPAEFDVLIGRDDELHALAGLLSNRRLITLTGLGGIGKTRLAIEAARGAIESYPAGVHFVDLASIRDVEMVVPAIAQVLSLQEAADRTLLESLVARIGSGRTLLVLDNLEHVADSAAVIRDLLAECPQLVILATSRVRLRLRGEQVFPVSALQTPEMTESVTGAQLEAFGATSLFLRRAGEVKPDLVPSDRVAPVIAAICQRLDGIPLAIELAAARCRVLSLPALLERLNAALDVLSGGQHDVPQRHRTLWETIAWSEALLNPTERAMFRRLSVFAGGWTLEAAGAVCGDLGLDVLDGLISLVDHSLAYQIEHADGAIRFRMLAPIRAFASEMLEHDGQTGTINDLHAAWFLRFAEERNDLFATDGSVRYRWLDVLATEDDNLRHALHWFDDQAANEALLRLSAALVWFWSIRGDLSEGRIWLERSLGLAQTEPPKAYAVALLGLGMLASEQGEWDVVAPALAESQTRFLALNDQRGVIAVLNSQGIMAARQGDRETAAQLFTAALEQARDIDVRPVIGELLNNLGVMSIQAGEVDQARALYDESLAQHRATGYRHQESRVLLNLGWIALDQERWADAEVCLTDALEIARNFGDRVSTVEALNVQGVLAVRQGNHRDAQAAVEESLALSRDLGYWEGAAYAIEVLAMIAIARRLMTLGVQLFAAASTLRETAGVPNNPQDEARSNQARQEAQAVLGDAQYTTIWNNGITMSLGEAVDIALSMGDADDRPSS